MSRCRYTKHRPGPSDLVFKLVNSDVLVHFPKRKISQAWDGEFRDYYLSQHYIRKILVWRVSWTNDSLALFVGLRVNTFGYMSRRCGVVHQVFSSYSLLVQAHSVYARPCGKAGPVSLFHLLQWELTQSGSYVDGYMPHLTSDLKYPLTFQWLSFFEM